MYRRAPTMEYNYDVGAMAPRLTNNADRLAKHYIILVRIYVYYLNFRISVQPILYLLYYNIL